jgi:hypothetical protein
MTFIGFLPLPIFSYSQPSDAYHRLGTTGLDYQLADGGKVVSLTNRSRSTPQKHYLCTSGAFLLEAE